MSLTEDQVKARLAALDRFKREAIGWAVWDLVVGVSGGLHGDFSHWPAHIQDEILKAIDRDCIPRPGNIVKIVASACCQDVEYEPCYIRVIVQEFPPIIRN